MNSLPVVTQPDTTATTNPPPDEIEDLTPPETSTDRTSTTAAVGRPAPRTAGRNRSNWSQNELRNFLVLMEEIVPIGPDEWDLVCSRHSTPFPGRDVDTLCRKYNTLHRKKCPTGERK